MPTARTVVASAPGKLIVIGEYAVLEGAPALVLALDRRVSASVSPGRGRLRAPQLGLDLGIRSLNPAGDAIVDESGDQPLGLTGRWIPRLLDAHGVDPHRLGDLDIEIDSSALYASSANRGLVKLGLGSSAAVSVALARALSAALEFGPDWTHSQSQPQPQPQPQPQAWFERLLPIYRDALGARASGADLAASLHGGAIFYRDAPSRAEISTARWPNGLQWCPVWTGQPAQTTEFVRRFDEWCAASPESGACLARLAGIAQRAARAAGPGKAGASEMLTALREYADELAGMAEMAGLEIVTPAHARLRRVADECGVVYKSCGAGGGDLGIAVSEDPDSLRTFVERIREKHGFPLESTTSEGVRLEEPRPGNVLPAGSRPDQ